MKQKRWLAIFALVCVATTALFALCNVLVDPFGVWGDRVLDWYAYNMTQNPRVAKLAYLDEHHAQYDSYILGSSKASSLDPVQLGQYMDGRFYNLTWYGGKVGDELAMAQYLIEHYEVRNLVWLVEPQNMLDFRTETDDLKERMHPKATGEGKASFYLSYLFCNPAYARDKLLAWVQRRYLVDPSAVYLAESGVYNKQRRDIEKIGTSAQYTAKNSAQFAPMPDNTSAPYLEDCLQAAHALVELCQKNGTRLIVLTAPQYESEFLSYRQEDIAALWRGLAQITDFWDFSGLHTIATDARYFYDNKHFRNAVGDMALARMFDKQGQYVPEDFGVQVTADNVEARLSTMWDSPTVPVHSTAVPILTYHAVTDDPAQVTDMTILVEQFEAHIKALTEQGYTAVLYEALADYVRSGTPLPSKPVVITFDDGYENNLTLAAPILQKYGQCAEIAVIGCSVGKDVYKQTGRKMQPHFSVEQAQPWIEQGVLALNSHSYDMHHVASLDTENFRYGMVMRRWESEKAYLHTLAQDQAQSVAGLPERALRVVTYPYGAYTELSEAALAALGVDVTVTTDKGLAELVCGLPQTLRALERNTITGTHSAEQVLAIASGQV